MSAPVPPIAVGNPRDPDNPSVNTVSEGKETQSDFFQSTTDTNDKVVTTITSGKTFFTYLIVYTNQTGNTDTLEIFDGPSATGTQKLKLVAADNETIVIPVSGFLSFTDSIVILAGNATGGNPATLTITGVEK